MLPCLILDVRQCCKNPRRRGILSLSHSCELLVDTLYFFSLEKPGQPTEKFHLDVRCICFFVVIQLRIYVLNSVTFVIHDEVIQIRCSLITSRESRSKGSAAHAAHMCAPREATS